MFYTILLDNDRLGSSNLEFNIINLLEIASYIIMLVASYYSDSASHGTYSLSVIPSSIVYMFIAGLSLRTMTSIKKSNSYLPILASDMIFSSMYITFPHQRLNKIVDGGWCLFILIRLLVMWNQCDS
jgi:hypothetical protein